MPGLSEGIWNAEPSYEMERVVAFCEKRKRRFIFAEDRFERKGSRLEEEEPFRFQVVMDKVGQPLMRCLDGKETVAEVALTVPGMNRLIGQGLMRKPGSWKVGALRNWVELEGEMFKFQGGSHDASQLEAVLNERY